MFTCLLTAQVTSRLALKLQSHCIFEGHRQKITTTEISCTPRRVVDNYRIVFQFVNGTDSATVGRFSEQIFSYLDHPLGKLRAHF
jgi:hypothetical protein